MYKKQNFYSGQKLKASQLDAMEDGIIQAQEDARNICYEGYAYDPIEWDGVIGSRENIDVSSSVNADPGSIYLVKLSDTILTREDCINSILVMQTPNGEENIIISENDVCSEAEIQESGLMTRLDYLMIVVDANKANAILAINIQTTGIYGVCAPKAGAYVKSFSKAIIKKIDEKFLPELASGANMEKGTGVRSVQQLCREDKVSMKDGETVPCFLFEGHADSPYNGTRVQFGAVGDHSISLGGRSAALGKCSIALNNQTIAVEENSCALGYATTALGACAMAGGTGTLAIGEAAVSLGMSTVAEAIYSLATGARTRAKGDVSSSFGVDTLAEAYASSVFGQWTIAREVNQTVVGQFNDPNKLSEHFHSVFQVGVGSSEETRMNGISISEGGEIAIRWNNAYYSLQGLFNILNNMLNMAGGVEGEDFFGEAKIK